MVNGDTSMKKRYWRKPTKTELEKAIAEVLHSSGGYRRILAEYDQDTEGGMNRDEQKASKIALLAQGNAKVAEATLADTDRILNEIMSYAYKQVHQSLYVYCIHARSLEVYIAGLAIIGIQHGLEYSVDPHHARVVRDKVLKIMTENDIKPQYIRSLERLECTPFEMACNNNIEAWDTRWEREISSLVLANYFRKSCAEAVLATPEQKQHLVNEIFHFGRHK